MNCWVCAWPISWLVVDPVSGEIALPIALRMNGPNVVNRNQTPNPIRADVAARRNRTDSSSPNASHSPT